MGMWGDVIDKSAGRTVRLEQYIEFMDMSKITPEELEGMMRSGIVHFQYRKKPKKNQPEGTGEIRDAWGTKKKDIITLVPHGGECPPKEVGYTVYFDVEKGDWRVFLSDRLIGVWDRVYDTEEEYERGYAKYMADKAKQEAKEKAEEELAAAKESTPVETI